MSLYDNVLADLCARFVINSPQESFQSWERLLFEVELAWWYYTDFLIPQNPKQLYKNSLKEFTRGLFAQCELLAPFVHNVDAIYATFLSYKLTVPTFGCALIDPTRTSVLLVKGFGRNSSWGFPKGKLSRNESEIECAVREVLEETGFDSSKLVSEQNSLSINCNDRVIKLYLAFDVPRDYAFEPQCRGEVQSYQWFELQYLLSTNDGGFWMVRQPAREIAKFLRAHPKASSSKTPKKKGDDSSGGAATLKTPAEKLAELAVALTASAGESRVSKSKSSPNLSSMDAKPLQSVREGFQTGLVGVEFNRRNGDTFGLHGKSGSGFSVEEMFQVNSSKFGVNSEFDVNHYNSSATPVAFRLLSDSPTPAQPIHSQKKLGPPATEAPVPTNLLSRILRAGEGTLEKNS